MSKWWICTDLMDIIDAGCDGLHLHLVSERDGQVAHHFGWAEKVAVTRHGDGTLASLSVRSNWVPAYGVWGELAEG